MLRAGGYGCARRQLARGGRGARRGCIGTRVRTSHAMRRDGTRTLGGMGVWVIWAAYTDVNCAMGRERAGRWERLLMGMGRSQERESWTSKARQRRALGVEEMKLQGGPNPSPTHLKPQHARDAPVLIYL